jgi:hypothetical protein
LLELGTRGYALTEAGRHGEAQFAVAFDLALYGG